MEGYKLNVEMAEELIPMLLYEMVNNDVITEEQALLLQCLSHYP